MMSCISKAYKSKLWLRATVHIDEGNFNQYIRLSYRVRNPQIIHIQQVRQGRIVGYAVTVFDRYYGTVYTFHAKGHWRILRGHTAIPDEYFYQEDGSHDDGLDIIINDEP